jgi:isochorismate pyruvate lyase
MDLELKGLTLPADCKGKEEIRDQIDQIDRFVLKALGLRYQYVKEIVKYKEKSYASVKAQARYDKVLQQRREWAAENGLDPQVIENIYKELIHHFIDEEMKLIQKETE